jgi:hypothetical protein
VRLGATRQSESDFSVTTTASSYLGELCEYQLSHQGLTLRAYELNPLSPDVHGAGRELWASVSPGDVVLLEPEQAA